MPLEIPPMKMKGSFLNSNSPYLLKVFIESIIKFNRSSKIMGNLSKTIVRTIISTNTN